MSNYPPGVTGNEYQIAGPDFERDEVRDCPTEGFSLLSFTNYGEGQIEQARALVKTARDKLLSPDPEEHEVARRLLVLVDGYLSSAQGEIDTVDIDGPCPFDDDVTVTGYAGVISWQCPVCKTLHEEEPE